MSIRQAQKYIINSSSFIVSSFNWHLWSHGTSAQTEEVISSVNPQGHAKGVTFIWAVPEKQ